MENLQKGMDLSRVGENDPVQHHIAGEPIIIVTGKPVVDPTEQNVIPETVENGAVSPAERDVSDNQLGPKKNSNGDDHGEHNEKTEVLYDSNNDVMMKGTPMVQPHAQLPRPEVPPGMILTPDSPPVVGEYERSKSLPESYDFEMPAIGKFIREKSYSLSSAITKRLSSLKENGNVLYDGDELKKSELQVTEIKLPGLKVIVNFKPQIELGKKLPGRVTLFSRSNCRDCTAVRSFLREKKLNYAEINVDVYPSREKELIDRTGSSSVPQIFFNDKLIGGLVALNSLRNSGMLDKKLEEMLAGKCPPDAPAAPVYGFDEPDVERVDELVEIVRVLRHRLPIQDRLMKMKIVKNCFSGAELVEVLIHHLDCGRKKAVEIGKQLARKHFFHHISGENEFEDGNYLYRFLEHEPFIPKCYNFRGITHDSEPKTAAFLSQRLSKIMTAILEACASDDRRRLDYVAISKTEEFRRYLSLAQDLQRVNMLELTEQERLAFFLNLYNAMAIHAVIMVGHPGGMIDRRAYFSDFVYVVGGYPYSLTTIRNGILRCNKRAPFSLIKPFGRADKRLELALSKINPSIHFALSNGTKSSPAVKFFTAQSIESELRYAAREFFQRDDAMQVDLSKRTVHLSRLFKWYSTDFGNEKEILKWIVSYLDATKAGLLTHLSGDGGPVNIAYQSFDWSLNS